MPERNDRDEHIRACVARFDHLLSSEPEQLAPPLVLRAERAIADMAARQFDLLAAFEQARIPADEFYRAFVEATQRGYADVDLILGRPRFLRIFEAPPEAVAELFDPEAFAAAQRTR